MKTHYAWRIVAMILSALAFLFPACSSTRTQVHEVRVVSDTTITAAPKALPSKSSDRSKHKAIVAKSKTKTSQRVEDIRKAIMVKAPSPEKASEPEKKNEEPKPDPIKGIASEPPSSAPTPEPEKVTKTATPVESPEPASKPTEDTTALTHKAATSYASPDYEPDLISELPAGKIHNTFRSELIDDPYYAPKEEVFPPAQPEQQPAVQAETSVSSKSTESATVLGGETKEIDWRSKIDFEPIKEGESIQDVGDSITASAILIADDIAPSDGIPVRLGLGHLRVYGYLGNEVYFRMYREGYKPPEFTALGVQEIPDPQKEIAKPVFEPIGARCFSFPLVTPIISKSERFIVEIAIAKPAEAMAMHFQREKETEGEMIAALKKRPQKAVTFKESQVAKAKKARLELREKFVKDPLVAISHVPTLKFTEPKASKPDPKEGGGKEGGEKWFAVLSTVLFCCGGLIFACLLIRMWRGRVFKARQFPPEVMVHNAAPFDTHGIDVRQGILGPQVVALVASVGESRSLSEMGALLPNRSTSTVSYVIRHQKIPDGRKSQGFRRRQRIVPIRDNEASHGPVQPKQPTVVEQLSTELPDIPWLNESGPEEVHVKGILSNIKNPQPVHPPQLHIASTDSGSQPLQSGAPRLLLAGVAGVGVVGIASLASRLLRSGHSDHLKDPPGSSDDADEHHSG